MAFRIPGFCKVRQFFTGFSLYLKKIIIRIPAGKMASNEITSLRRYRAHRIYKKFIALPASQQTNSRAALLLEAIFEYAYEHVPRARHYSAPRVSVSVKESARISERLEEFLPMGGAGDPIMKWLHDNMIAEAWSYPEDRRQFVRDCLRR